LKKFQPEGAVV